MLNKEEQIINFSYMCKSVMLIMNVCDECLFDVALLIFFFSFDEQFCRSESWTSQFGL